MTKIFRCSYYRSKQPELPDVEESAAGEYVDLEDGQGKHGGGGGEKPESGGAVDSGGPLTIDFVALIGIYCITVGCFFLGRSYLQTGLAGPDFAVMVIAGAFLLALGAAALAALALRGNAVSSWFRVSD